MVRSDNMQLRLNEGYFELDGLRNFYLTLCELVNKHPRFALNKLREGLSLLLNLGGLIQCF